MMTPTRCTLPILVLGLSSAALNLAWPDATPPSTRAPQVVATVGDRAITASELDEMAKERLARIRSEEHNIKRQVLEEYVTRLLLELEARARGISVAELTKREIDEQALTVSDDQKRAVYESSPQAFQGRSQSEAFAQIDANLRRIRTSEAREKLLRSLRAKTPVKILLEPPRFAVVATDSPTVGPETAPVTIVGFSDFQCPYCSRVVPTLKQLGERYAGKIRIVFRDFPLTTIHKDAQKAAEAGRCAFEQGRFWEMHDLMFGQQQRLAVSELKKHAAGLGLDMGKFGDCLDSGRTGTHIARDVQDAGRLGVSGTPTFFVNGRRLTGGATYQNFAEAIEDELGRTRRSDP